MNTVLLPGPSLTDPPEHYYGTPVSEADYWESYCLGLWSSVSLDCS